MLRSKKKDYNKLFKSSLENKKSFFRNLNHVLGRKKTSPSITSLRVKKEVITDDIKIANCLNEHFATVGEQLVSNRNSSKNSKTIGVISKLGHFVSQDVMLMYYNFYIKPVLCNTVFLFMEDRIQPI